MADYIQEVRHQQYMVEDMQARMMLAVLEGGADIANRDAMPPAEQRVGQIAETLEPQEVLQNLTVQALDLNHEKLLVAEMLENIETVEVLAVNDLFGDQSKENE